MESETERVMERILLMPIEAIVAPIEAPTSPENKNMIMNISPLKRSAMGKSGGIQQKCCMLR